MTAEITDIHSRFAVLEIQDGGNYNTDKYYTILLNRKVFSEKSRSVNFLYPLKPDTHYEVMIGEESQICFDTLPEFVTLNVRRFGAVGDGIHNDTVYIQAAIMACPENSRVYIPRGKYLVTSLFIKSHVDIELAEGAEIIASKERYEYPIMPGMLRSYDEQSEYNLGTWEGNPLPMFSGIFTGIGAEDVNIYGKGTINGNASHDDWWYDEKVMRGAFRPRLIFLERCSDVSVFGIHLENSPSWTIHPYFSKNIDLCALSVTNPEVSPNTDGIDIESCSNAVVRGVDFTLGDDCIALKSGKIYMGRKYRTPCENVIIRNCSMKNGHGAVTVGSELSGGIRNISVTNCDFINTDRGLRIKTRRGRGNTAVIGDIIFRDIAMQGVKVPFALNAFYFCDPDGRTEYVQCRSPLPVDERTPFIGEFVFENVVCTDCHACAAFFIGLPESMIESITMKNVHITFSGKMQPFTPEMLFGVDKMHGRGIIAENVKALRLENVTIDGTDMPPVECTNVDMVEGEVICR